MSFSGISCHPNPYHDIDDIIELFGKVLLSSWLGCRDLRKIEAADKVDG